MNLRFSVYAVIAALLGGVSVAIGAFATHGVTDAHAKALLETGVRYQFMHATAAIAALVFWRWGAARARHAPPLFFAGALLFSGSLYALACGAPRWAGAITPLGGLALLAGWIVLAWAGLQLARRGDLL